MCVLTKREHHVVRRCFTRGDDLYFYRWMGLWLVISIPCEIALCHAEHINGLRYTDSWLLWLLLAWAIVFTRLYPFPRLVEPLQLMLLASFLKSSLGVLSVIVGRSTNPVVDQRLAGLDDLLGFSTGYWVHLVRQMPTIDWV